MKQFELPEKWCIKGCDKLDKYQKVELQGKSNYCLNYIDYYYYNNSIDLDLKKWKYFEKYIPEDYTEITFEQFERYVLNKVESKIEIEKDDYSHLVKLLKQIK